MTNHPPATQPVQCPTCGMPTDLHSGAEPCIRALRRVLADLSLGLASMGRIARDVRDELDANDRGDGRHEAARGRSRGDADGGPHGC